MDLLKQYLNKLILFTENIWLSIKRKILGPNNERLDFLIDSFSKLEPEQRVGIVIGGIVVGIVFVSVMLFFYFSKLHKLETELTKGFDSLYKLYNLKQEYQKTESEYQRLIQNVRSITRDLKVRPFFEEMAQKIGVEIQGLNEQRKPLPADNKLSANLQYIKAEMRFPNISIPRLLNFLIEVEKSNKFLSVENIQIRSKYGTKLFFDVQVSFRGYAVMD